jgi:hypothetical protein
MIQPGIPEGYGMVQAVAAGHDPVVRVTSLFERLGPAGEITWLDR